MVKNLPANTGDVSLVPRLGTSLGEGNSNLLQYSCLGNPMDRGPGRLNPWGGKESAMTWRLNYSVPAIYMLDSEKVSDWPY